LFFGIALIAISVWLLAKNRKQRGWMAALLRMDTLAVSITGFYLMVTAF
jgi:hypothetical protein